MSWMPALGFLSGALLFSYLPGLAVTSALRTTVLGRLATAPVVTILLTAGTAVIASALDLGWSWHWVVGSAAGLAIGAHLLARRRPRPAPRLELAQAGQYLVGMVISMLLTGRIVLWALRGPDAFAQRFDNAFHLNAVRLIVDTGRGGPLDFGVLGFGGFYPAAWHDWVASVIGLTGAPVTAAVQVCTLVLLFAIWPLSIAWLAESWLPITTVGRIILGPLSLAAVSFPLALLDWGTLYPNQLALALAPVGLAAAWQGLGLKRPVDLSPTSAVVVAGVAGMAAALAHPNAVFFIGLGVLPAIVVALWPSLRHLVVRRGDWRGVPGVRRSRLLAVIWLGAATGFVVFWRLVGARVEDAQWDAFQTPLQALIELAEGTSVEKDPVWWLTVGMVTGALFLLVKRRRWVLLASFAAISLPYLVTSAIADGPVRDLIGGPFYNDNYRTAAATALWAVPLGTFGWQQLVVGFQGQLTWLMGRLRDSAQPLAIRVGRWTTVALALIMAGCLGVLVPSSAGWQDATSRVYNAFYLSKDSDILTSAEYALITALPEHVPPDATIVVNPWQGGGLAYALADRKVTQYYMFDEPDAEVRLINLELNKLNTNPEVCAALTEQGASFVLALEPHYISDGYGWRPHYVGLTDLATTPGLQPVARANDTVLYRITACG